jgi:diacylglycerol kinase
MAINTETKLRLRFMIVFSLGVMLGYTTPDGLSPIFWVLCTIFGVVFIEILERKLETDKV